MVRSVIARWESRNGRHWVEVTESAIGSYAWRSSHALAAQPGPSLPVVAARAAIEAAFMPGQPLTRTI